MSDEEYQPEGADVYESDQFDNSFGLDDAEMDEFIDAFKRDETTQVEVPEPIVFSDDEDDLGEEDADEHYDLREALRSAANFRTKKSAQTASKNYYRRKMLKSATKDQSPEVIDALSKANDAFIRQDYLVAQAKYQEVISHDSQNFFAYKTLGEICKIQGRLDQCCNYWLIAALIHNWDTSFWGAVGELSAQLGYTDQAIHCYSRAITLDTVKLSRYILDRSNLYREIGSYGRALDGLNKVRQAFPLDPDVVKQIALIYLEQKRLNDAISMYWEIFKTNVQADPDLPALKRRFVTFGWPELNILLELHEKKGSWRDGIDAVKKVVRWMQGRMKETWWDDTDDDAEFDLDRRSNVINSLRILPKQREALLKADASLFIDIRYRLGVFRLELGQHEEALRHFSYLFREDEEIDDLFLEAGKALENHGLYESAIEYLVRACQNEDIQNTHEVYVLLGKCFLEINEYENAREAYQNVLVLDPHEPEHYVIMMEILLYLDERDEALKINDQLRELIKSQDNVAEEQKQLIEEGHEINEALIKSQRILLKQRKQRMSPEEREFFEKEMTTKVLNRYQRMEKLNDLILAGDQVAIKTWCEYALRLIDMFTLVKEFFPRDRNKVFLGILKYRRRRAMKLDQRMLRLQNLVEDMEMQSTLEDGQSKPVIGNNSKFRGLKFDQWFDIFCQYSLLLAKFENEVEHGQEVMELAMHIGAFIQDKSKELFMHLVQLHLAQIRGDYTEVSKVVRYFLNANQFSPFVYKFFTSCYALGVKAWDLFTSYNHQKFFLRQLKAYDSVITGKKITGMANVVAPNIQAYRDKLGDDLPELTYMYGSLLGGARLFALPIVYLSRAYKQYNQDYMICLQLAVTHVHRLMQRLSSNRQTQLLQGISFLMEYRQRRLENGTNYEKQEVEYNFGRMFHMLGLPSLAAAHYENVLKYEVELLYDLSIEAAYNLSLIYLVNGNTQLARELTNKYLTV